MKTKVLFVMACLTVLGMKQANAQVAKVALSHNGNITMYNAEELQTAIDASVDGDTLFLNEGTFKNGNVYSGDITINKKIALIGTGERTILAGGIIINYTGKLSARMLDGLHINSGINVATNDYLLDNLIIRKCSFRYFESGGSLSNATIDRCFNYGKLSSDKDEFCIKSNSKNTKVATVLNSIISLYYGKWATISDVTFVNCNIIDSYYDVDSQATFINCVVNNLRGKLPKSYFSYCYLAKDNGINTTQNCQYGNISWASDYQCTSTEMLGQDGTPVGITGGTTPYTLVPTSPKMESFDLKVDAEKRKLNVNIKMTAN